MKKQDKCFDANMEPKEFKNEKEFEKLLDSINQKGGEATPEEKEKRMNCIKEKHAVDQLE